MFREVRNVAAERIKRGETNYGGRGGGGGGGGGGGARERRQQKNKGCVLYLIFFLAPSPIVFSPVWPLFLRNTN